MVTQPHGVSWSSCNKSQYAYHAHPQAALARGAGEASAAEAACRRALAARAALAGSAASLPVASAQCLLAQLLLDLGRCEACSQIQ